MIESDWNILKVIREEKSIRKAAERLYISQPSLTYRLNQLEKQFETQLFARTSKGVEITPQGEMLYQHTKLMVQKLQEIKDTIKSANGKIQGVLRIGAFPLVSNYSLPYLLKDFMARYPDVQFKVTTGLSYKLIQLLFSEEIHLAIVRGDYQEAAQSILLKEEPICLVSATPIDLDQLPQLPYVSYSTKSSLASLLKDWWYERFSQPPKIAVESDNVNTCVKMVEAGLGYALLPAECLDDLTMHIQQLYKLDGRPVTRKTWLLFRAPALSLAAAQVFIEFLKTAFSSPGPAACQLNGSPPSTRPVDR